MRMKNPHKLNAAFLPSIDTYVQKVDIRRVAAGVCRGMIQPIKLNLTYGNPVFASHDSSKLCACVQESVSNCLHSFLRNDHVTSPCVPHRYRFREATASTSRSDRYKDLPELATYRSRPRKSHLAPGLCRYSPRMDHPANATFLHNQCNRHWAYASARMRPYIAPSSSVASRITPRIKIPLRNYF